MALRIDTCERPFSVAVVMRESRRGYTRVIEMGKVVAVLGLWGWLSLAGLAYGMGMGSCGKVYDRKVTNFRY